MNRSDVPRVAAVGAACAAELDRLGQSVFTATHDWQSPLRSGGSGPNGKGGHGDPVVQTFLSPDPLALEHAALVGEIEAFHSAAIALTARLRRLAPIDPTKIDRGRKNTVPACLVCAGPAPRCRRGLCDGCYTAWLRAGRPDFVSFRNQRLVALQEPDREHVDPLSHGLRTVG